MLELSQVSKHFGSVQAVSDVSFSVGEGEIFALLGPNGSGKTTLTRVIAGLLQPTGGSVRIAGVELAEHPIDAKRHVGYIPDTPEVWGRMTGREFLHFTGALYDMPPTRRAERIDELLPRFELGAIADGYFDQYSRGNRQKFTVLAALLHEPQVLLIDEPIVGLDVDSVQVLEDLLREFAGAGGAVLITTHTLTVAEHTAGRFGMLSRGSLTAVGTLAELKGQAGMPEEAWFVDVYRHFAHTGLDPAP